MNILNLSSYFSPEQVASSHLIKDYYETFANNDINTLVYTPTPCRGIDDETRKKYKKIKFEKLYNGTVEVHRFPLFKEGKNPLQRAFRYFLCIICHIICGLKEKNCDTLFISSTPPINGLIMAVLRKFKKYKIVYNLQDIFPDSLVNTGLTKKGSIIWKIGRWVENITYKSADKIIVISEGFKKNIMEKSVPEEKIVVIPNWVDENKVINVPREENTLFDKYDLDRNKFYVCYSGNIGFTQNMEALCYAAKKLESEENIGIIIVGDGAFKPQLEKMISEQKIKNITLLPFQNYSDISKVFSLGDVGLIISKAGIGTNSVPSKTWSIMSAERPVLACFDLNSELCEIVKNNNCGVCVSPDDVDALVCAIKDMKKAREENIRMGKNGRKYILENLTKEIGTGRYVDVLKTIVQEGR